VAMRLKINVTIWIRIVRSTLHQDVDLAGGSGLVSRNGRGDWVRERKGGDRLRHC
jgi:hypothetical protein